LLRWVIVTAWLFIPSMLSAAESLSITWETLF